MILVKNPHILKDRQSHVLAMVNEWQLFISILIHSTFLIQTEIDDEEVIAFKKDVGTFLQWFTIGNFLINVAPMIIEMLSGLKGSIVSSFLDY